MLSGPREVSCRKAMIRRFNCRLFASGGRGAKRTALLCRLGKDADQVLATHGKAGELGGGTAGWRQPVQTK